MDKYRICNRCLMTEKADSAIYFDKNGNCNYCNTALAAYHSNYFPNKRGEKKLNDMLNKLKLKNKNSKYDCLMGISGGLDSCYLAYLGAMKWGLRIAAVHVDDGFDTEISKENIMRLCKKCGIDINIVYPDKRQFSELCRAYMLAGVPNLAVPQDNVLFSCIYKFAKENNIHDFLSGGNFALESILQKGNTHNPYDLINIYNINKKFGREKIDNLPLMSQNDKDRDNKTLEIMEYRPLNYIRYTRDGALKELYEFCEFQYYGSKHLENYYTGFMQLYWLPQKFGVDKRTSHFSSMIISKQMTREEALEKIKERPYSKEWLIKAISLIKLKLEFTDEEFAQIMKQPVHKHTDFTSVGGFIFTGFSKMKKLEKVTRKVVSGYSKPIGNFFLNNKTLWNKKDRQY